MDEIKVVASALFGRRVLRSTRKMILRFGLQAETLRTHRLGRRVSLAQGTGYEMAAWHAAEENMLFDVPLLRAPFFEHFDPACLALAERDEYKIIGNDYLKAYSPRIAAVSARKAPFEAMLNTVFPPTRQKYDGIDDNTFRRYALEGALRDWRVNLSSQGEMYGNR
jgi:hypothetical protein